MIRVQEVTGQEALIKIYQRYSHTFPLVERRTREQFLGLPKNISSFVLQIFDDENEIGYAVFWSLTNFYFLEHFEIYSEYRNFGFGSLVLNFFSQKFKNIVLETEPSYFSEVAARRLHFYERNEFMVIANDYFQPAYHHGAAPVPMVLMANFPADYSIVPSIHNIVYRS